MNTLCFYKLIRLPEDADQIPLIADLLKKNFSLTSMEAYGQPVFEDEPEYKFSVRFNQDAESFSASASVMFMDSMIHFQIIASMKAAAEEPFSGSLEWDSVQFFEGAKDGQAEAT